MKLFYYTYDADTNKVIEIFRITENEEEVGGEIPLQATYIQHNGRRIYLPCTQVFFDSLECAILSNVAREVHFWAKIESLEDLFQLITDRMSQRGKAISEDILTSTNSRDQYVQRVLTYHSKANVRSPVGLITQGLHSLGYTKTDYPKLFTTEMRAVWLKAFPWLRGLNIVYTEFCRVMIALEQAHDTLPTDDWPEAFDVIRQGGNLVLQREQAELAAKQEQELKKAEERIETEVADKATHMPPVKVRDLHSIAYVASGDARLITVVRIEEAKFDVTITADGPVAGPIRYRCQFATGEIQWMTEDRLIDDPQVVMQILHKAAQSNWVVTDRMGTTWASTDE